MLNITPESDERVKKYIYSILIDLTIFLVLLITTVLLEETISNSFGNFGKYLFWIYIILEITIHIFSDTIYKSQSIGKKILKIKIQDKSSEKSRLFNIVLQRLIELPILVVKDKQLYFDKILRISNNAITNDD